MRKIFSISTIQTTLFTMGRLIQFDNFQPGVKQYSNDEMNIFLNTARLNDYNTMDKIIKASSQYIKENE